MLGHLISKGFSQDDEDEDGTREKQRESLLALLEERFLDVSSYTRSKVLQTWKDLITYVAGNGCTRSANSFAHVSLSNKCISSERAVPVKMLNSITRQTVLRLADKIAQVRKRAVLLLTAILEYNPYNNALPLALFEQSLQESETKVRIPTAHRETSSAFDSRLPCCCCCCGTHQLDALTQAQIERLKQSLEKTTGRRQNDAKSAKKGSRKSKRGTAAEVDDQDEQEGELHEQIIVETDDMDQEEADEAQAGEELAAQEDENSDENREIKNYEKRCETLREIVCFIRLFHQAMPGTNNNQQAKEHRHSRTHDDSTFVTLSLLSFALDASRSAFATAWQQDRHRRARDHQFLCGCEPLPDRSCLGRHQEDAAARLVQGYRDQERRHQRLPAVVPYAAAQLHLGEVGRAICRWQLDAVRSMACCR